MIGVLGLGIEDFWAGVDSCLALDVLLIELRHIVHKEFESCLSSLSFGNSDW